MLWCKFVFFVVLIVAADAAFEGDACINSGASGVSAVCRKIKECPSAINDVRNRRNPQICGFDGKDPVVCCADGGQPSTLLSPVSGKPPPSGGQTTPQGQCDPIQANSTAPKTGQKAKDKCIEYQEQLVFPCVKKASGGYSRDNRCGFDFQPLIIGAPAYEGEFPHMVLLGFGEKPESAEWQCSGTLVSDRFILTAAHCTKSRESGEVKYAILGALTKPDKIGSSKLYKIKRVISHPQFKPPSKYHDIALLETETQMALDQFAVPACLPAGDEEARYERAVATGWDYFDDMMQKVSLNQLPSEECAEQFSVTRVLRIGFDAVTQLCFGDKTRENCQGGSGGPLQVIHKRVRCMYSVVGVTSFGTCGLGVYTRVAAYVPWIETVVWP